MMDKKKIPQRKRMAMGMMGGGMAKKKNVVKTRGGVIMMRKMRGGGMAKKK